MAFTVGSLFAGIGGFDLGFERAGFKTSWQVEIDPYCLKVLAKNFPEAERFGDIRECCGLYCDQDRCWDDKPPNKCGRAHHLNDVDVICGGFPCQDISNAGKKEGISGERSGLWTEFSRIIAELRPRFVVIENVSALLTRGMGEVLGALAECGFDAEWDTVRSCELSAPHMRARLFIVAYPKEERRGRRRVIWKEETPLEAGGCNSELLRPWTVQPRISRVAYGVPNRVDRVAGCGNAVVPQIPEMIARRIKLALEQVAHI